MIAMASLTTSNPLTTFVMTYLIVGMALFCYSVIKDKGLFLSLFLVEGLSAVLVFAVVLVVEVLIWPIIFVHRYLKWDKK